MRIESYSVVFKRERRLRRVPETDWDIPWPDGIPLRGIAYFGAGVFVSLLLSSIPALDPIMGSVLMRFLGIPIVFAFFMYVANPDGRASHWFIMHWCLYQWRHRPADVKLRARRGKLRVRWDATSPYLHRMDLQGPARVVFSRPMRTFLSPWTKSWVVRPHPEGHTEFTIEKDHVWKVKP